MRSSLLLRAAIAILPLSLAACSTVLGYESAYETAAAGSGGNVAAGQAGAVAAGGAGAVVGGAGARPGGGAGAQASGGGGQAGANAGAGGVGASAGMGGAGSGAGTSGVGGSGGGAGSVGGTGGAAGQANGGSSGTMSGGAAGTGNGGSQNPTDCSVIYVSPQGDDANDGCSPTKPKKRPVDALAAAGSNTAELRFCAGTFASDGFELTKGVSLRGSYDCTSWARAPFGSTSVRSTITAAPGAKAALLASTVTVTRGVEIEGLAFAGGSGSATSRGVWITKGAAPTIRDCALQGGKAASAALGSVGIFVDQGGAPRLLRNLVKGGDGDTTAESVASVGLYLASDAGLVDVEANRIEGGRGIVHGKGLPTTAFYAEPLLFPLTGQHAMVDNVFVGGEGSDASEARYLLSTALFLEGGPTGGGSSIHVRGGQIIAGRATVGAMTASDRQTAANAVFSARHVLLRIEGARIYGGDAPGNAGVVGAFALTGGLTQLVGSLVHAGGAQSNTSLARIFNLSAQGDPPSVEILASTLLTGKQTGGAATVYSYGPSKIVMRSNFIVQQTGYAPVVMMDVACDPAAGSVFEANAFAFTRSGDPLVQLNAEACKKNLVSTAELQARYAGSTGNVRVTPTNGASPDVTIACAGGASCLEKLFVTFDATSSGLSQVLSPSDDELSPRLPALCALAIGGKLLPDSPNDLLGRKRPATRTSMGAFQVGGVLCP